MKASVPQCSTWNFIKAQLIADYYRDYLSSTALSALNQRQHTTKKLWSRRITVGCVLHCLSQEIGLHLINELPTGKHTYILEC